ncbi:MAG: hypothetical protein ACM30H_06815 [Clostridia bacterium]
MKRTLLAVAATLALGSFSAAQAEAGIPQPSFKDTTDLAPAAVTGTQTAQQNFPKPSYGAGVSNATVVLDAADSAQAQYASTGPSATRNDAVRADSRPHSTLNDSFHYPY